MVQWRAGDTNSTVYGSENMNIEANSYSYFKHNLIIGSVNPPTSKLQVVGSDSTDANFALKTQNSALSDLFSVRNDGYSVFGNSFVQIDPATEQFGIGAAMGLNGAMAAIYSGTSNKILFDIVNPGGGFENIYRVRNIGSSGTFGTTWNSLNQFGQYTGLYGVQIASDENGSGSTSLTFDSQDGAISGAQIYTTKDVSTAATSEFILLNNGNSFIDRYFKVDGVKSLGYPSPFVEVRSGTDDATTSIGVSRISSMTNSYVAVESGSSPVALNFGIGTASPAEKLHLVGRARIDDTTDTGKTISTDFLPININGTLRYIAIYD
jgi:hypothetical protein